MGIAYEYRYTDRDVREDPMLSAYAEDYLNNYGGDFEFLTAAKLQMTAVGIGGLPTAVIRGVLNCMRADAQYTRAMPEPRYGAAIIYAPRLTIVKTHRPTRIRLKTVFKKPYIMSQHKLAQVVHILDQERTFCTYLPHARAYQWEPELFCHKQLYSSDLARYIMVDMIPDSRRICPQCELERLRRSSTAMRTESNK